MSRTPFSYVFRRDLAGLIRSLENVDINITNIEGQTLLHQVSGKDPSVEIAQELIRRGIDVNRQAHSGATALAFTAWWDSIEVAELILKAGGRLDISDEHGNQPLWIAVVRPRPCFDLIKLFLKWGADSDHVNRYGKTPRSIALARSDKPFSALFGRAGEKEADEKTGM